MTRFQAYIIIAFLIGIFAEIYIFGTGAAEKFDDLDDQLIAVQNAIQAERK